jgi:hypothetical protein
MSQVDLSATTTVAVSATRERPPLVAGESVHMEVSPVKITAG